MVSLPRCVVGRAGQGRAGQSEGGRDRIRQALGEVAAAAVQVRL